MTTSDRLRRVDTDDLVLLLVEMKAENDFRGLDMHLFLWVDDESKQEVRKTGILAKEDVVKGETVVLN